MWVDADMVQKLLIWTLLDHFRQNLIFCLKTEKCFLAEVIWSKKSSFVWNDPKESKWVQNGPKWSKICYIDHFGSFWTLVDHFGTSATLPFLVIFGPKRAFLDPPAHMIEGRQGPKLLQTNFVLVSVGNCMWIAFWGLGNTLANLMGICILMNLDIFPRSLLHFQIFHANVN